MMFQSYDDLLSVDELCEVLKIGRNLAYQLLDAGAIKAFRCGRIWKIPKSALIEFITERAQLNYVPKC